MTNQAYTLRKDELIIFIKKRSLSLRIVLVALIILSLLLPTFGIYNLFQEGKITDLLILFLMVAFYLIPVFFFRLLLWNTWGSEIFVFQQNKLNYVADYKWFKDGETEIETVDGFTATMEFTKRDGDNIGTLLFNSEFEEIRSVAKLSKADMNKIIEKLIDSNLIKSN